VTSGGDPGTSGQARFEWGPWLVILAVGSLVTLVNITSELLEAQRDNEQMAWWHPVTWEMTSLVVNLALAPFIGEAIRRLPPRQDNLLRFFSVHLALTVPYSLVHVAGMVGLRKAAYAATGGFYDFTHGVLGRELFYEWRKDVLVYAMLAAVYFLYRRYDEHRAAKQGAREGGRIEIRDGGAAVFLAPADILFVEAAGNYVNFITSTRTYLVRGTLASWEARLTARGFVRVHRSHLVNRARIASLKPTAAGDLEITLDSGRTLAGSRRYRAALESPGEAASR
jgi:hypothetical protein